MTAPLDSVIAKLAARRGLIAPETAERLLREAEEQSGVHISQLLVRGGWCTPAQVELLSEDATKHGHLPAIAGYELVSKLGEGGMGVVYLATQLSMQRQVALKVLASHLAQNREFAERFLREARAAGRVVHPNVVGCHDAGEDGGHLFMALEYVAGGDADRLLKLHGRLPERRALEIARDCAAGLEALNAAGVIHRDIKPANIFLDQRGQAKLGDLGLARSHAGEDRMTLTGIAVGTPAFMSPEQANGDADLDIRSDIYSLGASLFQLLTGEPPYRGNSSWAVVAKAINDPFPDPRTYRSDISQGVASVVLCAAAKNRARRHASPTTLREDLELLLAGQGPRHAPLVRAPATVADPSLRTVVLAAGGGASSTVPTVTRRARARPVHRRVAGGRAGLWIGLGLLVGLVCVAAIVLRDGRTGRLPPPLATTPLAERIAPPTDLPAAVAVVAEKPAVAPEVPAAQAPVPPPIVVVAPVPVPALPEAPLTTKPDSAPVTPIPAPVVIQATDRNLVAHGDFENLEGRLTKDWKIREHGVEIRGGADGHWLAVTRVLGEKQQTATCMVLIPRDARTIRVSARLRASGVQRGSEYWHLPGMFIHVNDKAGRRVDRPPVPERVIDRDTKEWRTVTSEFPVPRTGSVIRIHFTIAGPAGTLEVDDVVVEADPQ